VVKAKNESISSRKAQSRTCGRGTPLRKLPKIARPVRVPIFLPDEQRMERALAVMRGRVGAPLLQAFPLQRIDRRTDPNSFRMAARRCGHVTEMNRQANMKRRRQMAASGAMPASLAAEFTQGEDAALCIVADECRVRGFCDLSNDAIAARAGGHRTTVQRALRKARELGLIIVQNRGRHGQRNLTNVVRIIAPEWLAWLRKGGGS
jgi:hypothetical protein